MPDLILLDNTTPGPNFDLFLWKEHWDRKKKKKKKKEYMKPSLFPNFELKLNNQNHNS